MQRIQERDGFSVNRVGGSVNGRKTGQRGETHWMALLSLVDLRTNSLRRQ